MGDCIGSIFIGVIQENTSSFKYSPYEKKIGQLSDFSEMPRFFKMPASSKLALRMQNATNLKGFPNLKSSYFAT